MKKVLLWALGIGLSGLVLFLLGSKPFVMGRANALIGEVKRIFDTQAEMSAVESGLATLGFVQYPGYSEGNMEQYERYIGAYVDMDTGPTSVLVVVLVEYDGSRVAKFTVYDHRTSM